MNPLHGISKIRCSIRTWLVAIGLALVVLSPMLYFVYQHFAIVNDPSIVTSVDVAPVIASVQFEPPASAPRPLEVGAELLVKQCRVVDGHRFEVCVEGNRWIEVHLTVVSKEEASQAVVDLMKRSDFPQPSVVLRRQIGSYWIADFRLTVDGKRASISEVLKARNLVF